MKKFLYAVRDLFLRLLPQGVGMAIGPHADFIFIIHPRHIADVPRQYPFAKYLPKWAVEGVLGYLWPVLGPSIGGLKSKEGRDITGWVIFSPLTAEQMVKEISVARKRIIQAVKLGERLGPKVIGLGGLCPPIMRGGWESLDGVKALITTGRIYTAVLVIEDTVRAAEQAGIHLPSATVAIIGAAGLMGSLVAKIMVGKAGRLILIDRRWNALVEIAQEIKKGKNVEIDIFKDVESIREADVVIAATDAYRPIIPKEGVKHGAVVIDSSQPPNAPKELEEREDVLVIEGGITRLRGVNCQFDFGLLYQDEVFGCLAEAIILCCSGKYSRADLEGKSDLELAEEFTSLGRELGFTSSELRSFGKRVEPSRLERIRLIHASPA